MLSAPLRDRFGIVEHMNYYTQDELTKIIFVLPRFSILVFKMKGPMNYLFVHVVRRESQTAFKTGT